MLVCALCKNRKIVKFHKLRKYQFFLCSHCHALFLHPQPSLTKIDKYYQSNFLYEAGRQNKTRTSQQAIKIINNLKRLNPRGKTLLDIGCGFGYFLKEAENLGLQTTGIEPSKKLYHDLVNYLTKSKIINSDWKSYVKKYKLKFDFITLNHVIEHLTNPSEIIIQISKILKKNGFLFIETPNLDSHLFKIEQKSYTFLTPPQHLWVFSIKSIKQIINQIPLLEIIKSSTYSYPEHLMGIIKKILKIKDPSFVKTSKGKQRSKIRNQEIIKFKNLNLKIDLKLKNKNLEFFTKTLKFLLFDKLIVPLFTPILNWGGYGSILELYIKKK